MWRSRNLRQFCTMGLSPPSWRWSEEIPHCRCCCCYHCHPWGSAWWSQLEEERWLWSSSPQRWSSVSGGEKRASWIFCIFFIMNWGDKWWITHLKISKLQSWWWFCDDIWGILQCPRCFLLSLGCYDLLENIRSRKVLGSIKKSYCSCWSEEKKIPLLWLLLQPRLLLPWHVAVGQVSGRLCWKSNWHMLIFLSLTNCIFICNKISCSL